MYINEYYESINKIGPNMAKLVISLNEKIIRTEGLYAPRFFTGIVDVWVRFDEDYQYTIDRFEFDDGGGEFYEHDYVTDFVYNGMDPSNEDMLKLEEFVAQKVEEVVYGVKRAN